MDESLIHVTNNTHSKQNLIYSLFILPPKILNPIPTSKFEFQFQTLRDKDIMKQHLISIIIVINHGLS